MRVQTYNSEVDLGLQSVLELEVPVPRWTFPTYTELATGDTLSYGQALITNTGELLLTDANLVLEIE